MIVDRDSVLRAAAYLSDPRSPPEDQLLGVQLREWVKRNDQLPPGQHFRIRLEVGHLAGSVKLINVYSPS